MRERRIDHTKQKERFCLTDCYSDLSRDLMKDGEPNFGFRRNDGKKSGILFCESDIKEFCTPMRRVFLICLILLICAVIAACAHAPAHQLGVRPVRIALESEPIMLDPRLAVDAYSSKINELLYRGLFYYTDDLSIS